MKNLGLISLVFAGLISVGILGAEIKLSSDRIHTSEAKEIIYDETF